jgi:hypothetical protein
MIWKRAVFTNFFSSLKRTCFEPIDATAQENAERRTPNAKR